MSTIDQTTTTLPPPAFKLHPVHGIVWAAFWGTPLAAGIVMAINYLRLGNKRNAMIAALAGTAGTSLLFAIAILTPEKILDKIPNVAFYVLPLLLVYGFAKMFQAERINEHAARGGQVASAWPSVGIGILCLPPLLVALFVIVFATQDSFGTHFQSGKDGVYYSGNATEEDARRLAEALRQHNFFGNEGGASVQLSSTLGSTTLSFVLVPNAWNEADTVESFKEMCESLADGPLSRPLTVHLCNNFFEPQATLTIK